MGWSGGGPHALARARAHLMPGEGHLSLVATATDDILDGLTAMAGL
jgi:hypothetical protein